MRAINTILGAVLVAVSWATTASAVDFSFDGYVDGRIILPSGEKSWLDGGLGPLRYGASQPDPNFRIAEAIGQAILDISPAIQAVSVLRIEPEQRTGVDILETYFAWRPQPFDNWQWSVKAGAFFPSMSLENTDLGWTSPYTLTPSAINSWIGDELRTIGSEGTIRYHSGWGTLSGIAALYCCNEPAGTLLGDRGWSLDDRPTGLLERVRDPDASLALSDEPVPGRRGMFENIDGHVGWYAGLRWDVPDFGQLTVWHYDNNADPYAVTANDESYHTSFWSSSFKTRIASATVLAQAVTGDTTQGGQATSFASAFLLASYDIDDWRLSARGEMFQTRNVPSLPLEDEDGAALTTALFWNARDWLRVGAELLLVDSHRTERVLEGVAAEQNDRQFQLDARAFF
jgi:hypothetical protein